MSDTAKRPKRRWRQFTLSGLLVLMTLIVLLLVGWRMIDAPYRQQRNVIALVEKVGGRCNAKEGGAAWMRSLVGSQHFPEVTFVDLADCDQPDQYLDAIVRLPHLRILIVGGRSFGDEHLRRLVTLQAIEAVVLDSTRVTDEAVAEFAHDFPQVLVHRSQRRAIAATRNIADRVNAYVNLDAVDSKLQQFVPLPHFGAVRQVAYDRPLSDVDLVHLEAFRDLEEVEILSQRGESTITDAGLAPLAGASKLQRLWIWQSPRITDALFDTLKQLKNLESLSVSGTQISASGLSCLSGFPNLKELLLTGSSVDDDWLVHVGRQKNIELLILGGSSITDGGLVHLQELTRLKNLQLFSTNVGDEGMKRLGVFKTLRQLRLDSTSISDRGLAHLADLVHLEELWLSWTKVSDEGLRTLAKFPKLDTLHLSNTAVTDAGMAHVAELKTLRYLALAKTAITPAAVRHLRMLPELEILDVLGTQFDDAALVELMPMRKLQSLRLRESKVTESGRQSFQKARRDVRID